MKIFLITAFLIFTSSVFAETPYFLSSEDLKKLTEKEQISYFIEVQKIIVEMSEASDYMANEYQQSRFSASIDETDMYLMKYLDKIQMTEEQYAKYRQIAITTPTDQRNNDDYRKAHKIWNGFNTYHANEKTKKENTAWIQSETQKRLDKENKEKVIREQELKIAEARHKEWMENYKLPSRSVIKQRRLERQERNQKAKALENEKLKSDFKKSEILAAEAYRAEPLCLFAGWIISTDRCRGPTQLPEDFQIPGVDRKKMQCQEGQFLCQPLLFGLKLPNGCHSLKDCASEALPLCVGFDSSITKTCQIRSFSTTKVAVELATLEGSNLFDQYRGQFYSLCEPELLSRNSKIQKNSKMKLDVEKTCSVAREKLQFLYQERVSLSDNLTIDEPKGSQK